jgi:methylenetetrahydrofolate dehydrogenase (NADP+)/methenyltetrahydrofolate cyclohydrolase
VAKRIRDRIAEDVVSFAARHGRAPGLTAVLVGDDPASGVYVRNKESASRSAGLRSQVLRLPADCTETRLLATVDSLNADVAVDGILVQLPLPGQIDERRVIERIDPAKDVDGFHPVNMGRLVAEAPGLVPCTPLGIMALLASAAIETNGARAVVLGRSNIVGKPLALLLLARSANATVTVCHTGTNDAPSLARQADILIAAIGRPEQITADWVKPGAAVVDVGIHRRPDGGLCGDVHPSVGGVAGWITPVPGGVGPMTIAMLLRNTLQAARSRAGESS